VPSTAYRRMSEPAGNWPSDDKFVGALVAFVERARSATDESSVTLDAWMRNGDPGRELVDLLERDPVVAKHAASGTIMRLAPSLGFAADTWLWVLGYVREALQPGADAADEARRLLRFLRLERGVVPARVRATLFGLRLEEPVELPFGRLLPGTVRDLAIAHSPDPPPAAVLECVVDCAAGMTHDRNDMVWPIEEGERLETEMYQRLDEQGLGRLLISLVSAIRQGRFRSTS
jgi:hypothetical protein